MVVWAMIFAFSTLNLVTLTPERSALPGPPPNPVMQIPGRVRLHPGSLIVQYLQRLNSAETAPVCETTSRSTIPPSAPGRNSGGNEAPADRAAFQALQEKQARLNSAANNRTTMSSY